MNFKRNKLASITLYIVCNMLFLLGIAICYQEFMNVEPYFLIVLIPCSVLFVLLFLSSFVKLIIIIMSMVFGGNDNEDTVDAMDKSLVFVNKITKYALAALYVAFLSSVMILDVILCISKERYTLAGISITVWILLHTILFKQIINIARNEKNNS